MAQFTRSAAEQFRPEETSVGWLWNIFVFSIVIFGSIALLYAGMEFGYKSFLGSQLETLQNQVEEKKNQINSENQNRLGEFYSQIYNLNKILLNHPLTSIVFKILEENTNVKISYTTFTYNSSLSSTDIQLGGSAPSLEIIARQLLAYKRLPQVKSVTLSSTQLEKEFYKFNLKIVLEQDYFNK